MLNSPVAVRSGAWVIHPVLIITGKIVLDTIPGMRPELSWTLTNLFYLGVRRHHRHVNEVYLALRSSPT